MKRSFKLAYVALVSLGLLSINGCKKDDTTAPVIVVAGDNPLRLELRASYIEPGVAATDDEDGSVAVVTDASDLNEDLPGTYTINYSATDAAGNVGEETRDVTVYATATALATYGGATVDYDVKDTCVVGSATSVYTYSQTLVANSATEIKFSKFGDYSNNGNIKATISESGAITLAAQSGLNIGSAAEDHDFAGTGSVTATGFTITYTDRNNSVIPVATATCRAHFTR